MGINQHNKYLLLPNSYSLKLSDEKAEGLNFKLYMAFIDNKIFDSIEQESVLQAPRNKGTQ